MYGLIYLFHALLQILGSILTASASSLHVHVHVIELNLCIGTITTIIGIGLLLAKKLGQNCLAGDGHSVGVTTLRDSLFMVRTRAGPYWAGLERRDHKLSCLNFLGQVDERIHQEAFPLVDNKRLH
ncbi:MAG TPA: hypothetical protein VJR02_11685 [Pyrinomonadaceae bacterium]|nr:hypothetical protein [Pyrinomonadaceae bacterium]